MDRCGARGEETITQYKSDQNNFRGEVKVSGLHFEFLDAEGKGGMSWGTGTLSPEMDSAYLFLAGGRLGKGDETSWDTLFSIAKSERNGASKDNRNDQN